MFDIALYRYKMLQVWTLSSGAQLYNDRVIYSYEAPHML